MLDVQNSKKIIIKNIIFEVLLLVIQVALILPFYLKINLDFKYTYYGTIALCLLFVLNFGYLLIYFIKCLFHKKHLTSFLLAFYMIISAIIYFVILFIGFIPISGVTLDGK